MNYLNESGLGYLIQKIKSLIKVNSVNGKTGDVTITTDDLGTDEKYAKLSLYGDTTINVGRAENSTVGDKSITLGQNCTATNFISYAEGLQTTSYGVASHSEGSYTIAQGNSSHAEGSSTLALGNNSHTEGQGTYTTVPNQHIQGKYNVIDTENKYAHIVGNGDGENNRSNAHTIDWNGVGWFAGGLAEGTICPTPTADAHITNKAYVDNIKTFVAVYGTTTYAEIQTAVNNGKTVLLDYYGTHRLQLTYKDAQQFNFAGFVDAGTTVFNAVCNSSNEWSLLSNNFPSSNNVVNGFWTGTQAQYDALGSYNATTLYLITE